LINVTHSYLTTQQQNIVRTCPSDSIKGYEWVQNGHDIHVKLVRYIVIQRCGASAVSKN